jgi:hypothetical protein
MDSDGSGYNTDLSEYVLSCSGKLEESDSVSGKSSSNTLSLTLDNSNGIFSPKNTASFLYGKLKPYKPIIVEIYTPNGDDCRVFTGFTGNWLPKAEIKTCELSCYDEAYVFSRKELKKELIYDKNNYLKPGVNELTWNFVFERIAWKCGIRWDWVITKDTKCASSGQVKDDDGMTSNITVVTDENVYQAIYKLGGVNGDVKMVIDIAHDSINGYLLMNPIFIDGYNFKEFENSNNSALTFLDKIAQVIDAKVYFDAQGILRVRSRLYLSDETDVTENFDTSNLTDLSYNNNYEDDSIVPPVNSIIVNTETIKIPLAKHGNEYKVDQSKIEFTGSAVGCEVLELSNGLN